MEDDLSICLDNQRTLWLTEISRAAYEDQGLTDVGGDDGLFVVLEDCAQGSYEVLAKAVSPQTGEALLRLIAERSSARPALRLVK